MNKTFATQRTGEKTYARSRGKSFPWEDETKVTTTVSEPQIVNQKLYDKYNTDKKLSKQELLDIKYKQNPNLKAWEEELNKNKEKYESELNSYNFKLKRASLGTPNDLFLALQAAKQTNESSKSDFVKNYEARQDLIDKGKISGANLETYQRLQKEDKAQYEKEKRIVSKNDKLTQSTSNNKVDNTPTKSEFMLEYEELQDKHKRYDVKVLDNGQIELRDDQIKEIAALYKSGSTNMNMNEIYATNYTDETRYKLENEMDQEGSQKASQIISEIKAGQFFDSNSNVAFQDAIDGAIKQYGLQEKRYFIDKIYDEFYEYNKSQITDADKTFNNIQELTEAVVGGIYRGYNNTNRATELMDILLTGSIDDAIKYFEKNKFETNPYEAMKEDALWHNERVMNGDTFAPLINLEDIKPSQTYSVIEGVTQLIGQMGAQTSSPVTMITTATGAIVGGLVGAFGGAGVGAVPGAVQGGKWGMTAGNALNSFRAEGGYAFAEMVEEGIDPEIAKNVATGVGVVNAGLEFAQVSKLMKWVNKTQVADDAIRYSAKELIKEYAVDVLENTFQEVAQESSTILGTYIGKNVHNDKEKNKLNQLDQYAWSDIGERLLETATSSAISFGILELPNMYSNTNKINTYSLTESEKKAEIKALKNDIKNLNNYDDLVVAKTFAVNGLELGNFTEAEKLDIVQDFDQRMQNVGHGSNKKTDALETFTVGNEKEKIETNKQVVQTNPIMSNQINTIGFSDNLNEQLNNYITGAEVNDATLNTTEQKEFKREKEIIDILKQLPKDEFGKVNLNETVDGIKFDIKKIKQDVTRLKETLSKKDINVYTNTDILSSFKTDNIQVKNALAVGTYMSDLLGIPIVYTYGENNNTKALSTRTDTNGLVVINLNEMLNNKYALPNEYLIGHELFHSLKAKHPNIMSQFVKTVADNITPEELALHQTRYGNKVIANDGTLRIGKEATEEVAADIFGAMITNRKDKLLSQVQKQNPTLFNKITKIVKDLISALSNAFTKASNRTGFLSNEAKITNSFIRKLNSNLETLTKDTKLTERKAKTITNILNSKNTQQTNTNLQNSVTRPTTTVDRALENVVDLPKLTYSNYRKQLNKLEITLTEKLKNKQISKEIALLQTQTIANQYVNTDIGRDVLAKLMDINIDIHELALVYNFKENEIDNMDYNKEQLFAGMGISKEELEADFRARQAAKKVTEKKTVKPKEKLNEKNYVYTKLDTDGNVIETTKKVKESLQTMVEDNPQISKKDVDNRQQTRNRQIAYKLREAEKKLEQMQARYEKEMAYKDMRIANEKAKADKVRKQRDMYKNSKDKSTLNRLNRVLVEKDATIRDMQTERTDKDKQYTNRINQLQKKVDETPRIIDTKKPIIDNVDLEIVSQDIVARKFNLNTAQQSTVLQEANAMVPLNHKIRTKQTVELVNEKVKYLKNKYSDDVIISHLLNTNGALKPVEQALLYDQMTTARNANDFTKSQMLMTRLMNSSTEAGLSLWFNREIKNLLPEFMVERTIDRVMGLVGDFMKNDNPKIRKWAANFDINSDESKAMIHNVKMYAEAISKIDSNDKSSSIKAEQLGADMKKSIDRFLPTDFNDRTVNAQKVSGMLTFGFGKLVKDVSSNFLNMTSQVVEHGISGTLGTKIANAVTKSEFNEYHYVSPKYMAKYLTNMGKAIINLPKHIAYSSESVKKAKKLGGYRYAAKVAVQNIANLSNSLANVIDISSEASLRESLKTFNIDEDTRNEIAQSMYDKTVMNLRGKMYETFLKVRNELNAASEAATNGKLHLGNYMLPVLKYSSNIIIPLMYRNPVSTAIYDVKTVNEISKLNKLKKQNADTMIIQAQTNKVNHMIQDAVGRTAVSAMLTIFGVILAKALGSDDDEERKIAQDINDLIANRWFENIDFLSIQAVTNTMLEPIDNPYNYIGNAFKGFGQVYLENTSLNSLFYPTKYASNEGEIVQNFASNIAVTAISGNIPTFVNEISDIIAKYTKQPKKNIYKNTSIEEQVWYRLLDRVGIGNFWGIPIANTKFGTFDDNILNDELSNLYTKVDENLYVNAPKTFSYEKEKYTLDKEQYKQFNDLLGQLNADEFMKVIRSKEYDRMTDAEKIEELKEIQKINIKEARSQIVAKLKLKPQKKSD